METVQDDNELQETKRLIADLIASLEIQIADTQNRRLYVLPEETDKPPGKSQKVELLRLDQKEEQLVQEHKVLSQKLEEFQPPDLETVRLDYKYEGWVTVPGWRQLKEQERIIREFRAIRQQSEERNIEQGNRER